MDAVKFLAVMNQVVENEVLAKLDLRGFENLGGLTDTGSLTRALENAFSNSDNITRLNRSI
jgi:hypothetical protein